MTRQIETLEGRTAGSSVESSRGTAPPVSDARAALLAAMQATERRFDLAGIPTAVLEGGEGPTIILLHGPGANATHWLRVMPELARTHRVIAPDLPGHGASDVPDGVLDKGRVLAWLRALLERTCTSPPALVGQLLGGAIAARGAIALGGAFGRLVLVDTFGLREFQPAPEFGAALATFGDDPGNDTHDELWKLCARDAASLRRDMAAHWSHFRAYNVERARSETQQTAQRELMLAFGVPAIPHDELSKIAIPTTLVWGRHDLATPVAVARTASQRHGWPLYVIENANDDPPVERPRAVCDVLRVALSENVTLLAAGVAS
jgi:pimeloyl-ACP methyl ester carboxylesterase